MSEVIAILVANGVPEASAAMLAGEILSDPTLEAGKWAIGRLYKLESILEVRQQLRDLAGEIDAVPRRSGVSSEQFLTEYYACNLPVLLEDVCHEWPALDRWSPDYLVEQLGDVEVEVMDGRQEGPGDELKMDEQRTRTSFAKYVRRVLATSGATSFTSLPTTACSQAISQSRSGRTSAWTRGTCGRRPRGPRHSSGTARPVR